MTPATRTLSTATVASPIGDLTLVADADALVAVLWPDDPPGRVRFDAPLTTAHAHDHPVLAAAADQLRSYFDGELVSFDLPLAPSGTDFQRMVWDELRRIPFGQTRSYGELAAAIGRPTAARAVGAANGRNPLSIVVPCHRVVGADGSLTGFAGGMSAKELLLDLESRIA